MEQTSQSKHGEGWSVPTPAELERPIGAVSGNAQSGPGSDKLAATQVPGAAFDKLTATQTPLPAPDSHAKFSDDVHNYVRESIRNADQKAAFFFAAMTAILAFLNTQKVSARWLKDIREWSFVDGLGFTSMLGLAVGAAILLAVIFPRLRGSRRGLIFFNAIAEYENSTEYADAVLGQSSPDVTRTKLQHCFDLSKICRSKYRMLRIGFWAGSIGAAAALAFLLLARDSAV